MPHIRSSFPLLAKQINSHPLIYFDNAATTQKPQVVIDAVSNFYANYNSNVHRGLNPLADEATKMYEAARDTVKDFINAVSRQEVIVTRGATEGINLVAKSWGRHNLQKGDRVVLSIAEHHANIVPWLQLKKEIGIELDFIPLNDPTPSLPLARGGGATNGSSAVESDSERPSPLVKGRIGRGAAQALLQQKNVKLLAITLCSNVLGAIETTTVQELCTLAREKDIVTLVDAAQVIAHTPVDVQELGCDFLVFSGHKVFGPTGIGVLYGKKELLEAMPAWQGGGDMIHEVFTDRFTENDLPYKFEAGTPHIAGAIGLHAALDFVNVTGWQEIKKQERELTEYFLQTIAEAPFVKLHGPANAENRAPVFALEIDGVHPHDAADILGQAGIITRAGHHCAQPLHDALGVVATLRASLSVYNTKKDIDEFFKEIGKIYNKFNQ